MKKVKIEVWAWLTMRGEALTSSLDGRTKTPMMNHGWLGPSHNEARREHLSLIKVAWSLLSYALSYVVCMYVDSKHLVLFLPISQ